jgi:HK97 family phage major capsid protein
LLTLDVANGEQLSAEEYRTLTAGQDTSAGFLTTPQEFVKKLIKRLDDEVFIRKLATVIPTNNVNGLGFPTLDVDPDDAEWSTEIKLSPEDKKLKFGKRELKPNPLKKLIKASDKLLRSDAMDPEALIIQRAVYKFGITEEKAYLLGTGDKQPLGLFTASAQGINTDRDISSGSATDFTGDALKKVKYSLKAQYMKTAQWLFHRDGVAKIALLKDGQGNYLFEMAHALGAMDQLMGRPLHMSEYVPNTFTSAKYVGMFGDFSHYYIADSLAMRIKRLNELFSLTSEVGFIFDKETDAMPVLSEAFSRIKTA